MGDLHHLPTRVGTLTCTECGNQWFETSGIVLEVTGAPIAYTFPLRCKDCGVFSPGPSTPEITIDVGGDE